MTVYFIKPIDMDGPIKIGCSQSPGKRKTTLEMWCPFPLEIVAEIAGGSIIEARFHRKFLSAYLRSEWFTPTKELKHTIRQINLGTFDVGTLPEYGGTMATLKRCTADYAPIDLEYVDLHHQFLGLPCRAQSYVRHKYKFSPSISAFLRLQPKTKTRHIGILSNAIKSAPQ